ncbi:MAG: 2-amino-4-hydroxy-6-hydroxymethyldihydropteridine diphosphokinase [Nitrospiria bacterium]
MERTYIGVGSNLGDRLAHCRAAVDALDRLERSRFAARSRWYETEPVGGAAQFPFINGVVELETDFSPRELLLACLAIERAGGRERGLPGGPRTVDLDILLYGDRVVDEPDLIIPHPRMAQRAFVLIPLAEIAPRVIHPLLGVSVAELRSRLDDPHAVRALDPVALGGN